MADTSVGYVALTVSAVEDRTLLSPEVLDAVCTEVIRRLDRRQASTTAQRDEAALWPSVRSRGSWA
jgi:hypothetical protein